MFSDNSRGVILLKKHQNCKFLAEKDTIYGYEKEALLKVG